MADKKVRNQKATDAAFAAIVLIGMLVVGSWLGFAVRGEWDRNHVPARAPAADSARVVMRDGSAVQLSVSSMDTDNPTLTLRWSPRRGGGGR